MVKEDSDEEEPTNYCALGSSANSNNKKKKDCQLLKDLQHENIQLKNKMSLLNTLLEKEQIRRKKAENTKPEDIISKHQNLALIYTQRMVTIITSNMFDIKLLCKYLGCKIMESLFIL